MPRQRTTPAATGRGRKSTTPARDGNARQRGGQVSYAELVKLAKRGIESHTAAANELGLPVTSVSMLEWCKALVEVGVWDEIPATAKAVKSAKENDRNRWELIAARAGISVQAARDLYGDEEEQKAAAVRGGSGNGNGSTKSSKTTTKSTGTTRGAKKGTAAAAASGPKRARTLAERRAANRRNPS